MDASFDGRREPREEVLHRIRIGDADRNEVQAVLVNLSPGGAMIRCDRVVAPGERLWVRLPVQGSIEAEVRWALGGRIGCRFVRSLSADDYARVLDATRRE